MQTLSTPLQCTCEMMAFEPTLTILDWDDTLMCTTVVQTHAVPDNVSLATLDDRVVTILQTACSYVVVYIVTNATTEWVFESASRFLPRVSQLLLSTLLTIVSARNLYEHHAPNQPVLWKTWVFQHIMTQHRLRNVVSVGDSIIDREATYAAVLEFPMSVCKYVKFADTPSLPHLIQQLMVLNEWFARIVAYCTHIDIHIDT